MTLTLEKPALIVNPPTHDTQQPAEFHWTVDSYYKAYDAGVFGYDARLELIHGRITVKMPPGPPYASLADIVAEMLRNALQPPWIIREEKPIHIAFDGEPVPDISVVRGTRADYRMHHPSPEDVSLIVEVSDTTVLYDLGGKSLLYAQAGIEDYWVVLVNDGAITKHRKPTPCGYQSVVKLSGADVISPLCAPEAVWTVDALLGIETQERV